ncbi:YbbC/YhhH family protein [Myroides sp. WP-1]|uniref:YbbC/YhhH family protein n=1 Tax=Myroides sp. WP-1 TaxID=2759944 RepID=UPI0015FAAA4D|nr:YbbC/YhhH family protein [Myroides sp. WP-1]MBB1140691.1 YbbC/YhhH family protein [Myroides sp. WP-1]
MMKNSVLIVLVLLIFACNKTMQTSNDHDTRDTLRIFEVTEIPLDYDNFDGIDKTEGYVPNADIAVQIAESILFNIYKKELIIEQRPYNVFFKNNSVWCVEGNLSKEMDGGVFYIEIRKSDGAILKVLHTK